MGAVKKLALFVMGGLGYVGIEMLWRGWSHRSMFFAGGLCFLALGKLRKTKPLLPLPVRGLLGAVVITSVELLTGLLVNRSYSVWDYRRVPGNFHGQICLPYCLLWLPVSLLAMEMYLPLERLLNRKRRT